ncbi:MAG: hypothetical protein AAF578_06515 [Pseudomonadota bacterium]
MHSVAVNAFTFLTIVSRGYLFLSGANVAGAILDAALLPVYIGIALHNRKYVFHGLIAYLAASSVFYLPLRVIPFDLSYLIILLATVTVMRGQRGGSVSSVFRSSLISLGGLLAYLAIQVFLRNLTEPQDLQGQIKVIYYLLNALVASYLFSILFSSSYARTARQAVMVGVVAYLIAASIGYLFPLESYTWQLETDYRFKSLFRYPGLSSSNYVANIILVLLALHKLLQKESTPRSSVALYLIIITVTAVLSQSRGFAISALAMLITWAVQAALHARPKDKEKANRYGTGLPALLLLTTVAALSFSSPGRTLIAQTADRFTFNDISISNVDDRFNEWTETYGFLQKHAGSAVLGNLSNTEDIRPHNVTLGAVFLFGVPIGLAVSISLWLAAIRYPDLLFVLLAAQVEILFFTGTFDFLFLVFLCLVADNRQGNAKIPQRSSASIRATP